MEANIMQKARGSAPKAQTAVGALTTRQRGVLEALATKLECDPVKLMPMLKKTAFATCRTDEEFMAMCMVANTYNLNPILKEIYAFPGRGGNVMPIVGVDGWIKLMNSHPQFDGIEFEQDDESCTAVIYRKDRTHAIKVTEYLSECGGQTEPWRKWPKRMLRHKAMVQAARIAFGFAGIYDPEEAERMAPVLPTIDAINVEDTPEAPKKPSRGASQRKPDKQPEDEPQTPHAPEKPQNNADEEEAIDPVDGLPY